MLLYKEMEHLTENKIIASQATPGMIPMPATPGSDKARAACPHLCWIVYIITVALTCLEANCLPTITISHNKNGTHITKAIGYVPSNRLLAYRQLKLFLSRGSKLKDRS